MLGRHRSLRAFSVISCAVIAALLGAIELGELAAARVMRVDPPGGLSEADARASAALLGDSWPLEAGNEPSVAVPLPTVEIPLNAALKPASLDYPAKRVGRPITRGNADDSGVQQFLPPPRTGEHTPLLDAIPHGRVMAPAADGAVERSIVIASGDTLNDILLREGVAAPVAHDALAAMRDVLDLRALKPGIPLTLTFVPDSAGASRLLKVSLPASVDEMVKVERGGNDGFRASREALPLTRQLVRASGVIRSSLYEDAVAAGIPPTLLAELIRAFSYDVDFQREIQPGDRFEIAYEQFLDRDGQVAKTGNIAYAALTLSGLTLKIYRFQPQRGFADYFNGRGESVRKALLRTPVDGARISSGYGMRLHPILGYTTMHKGVDFAAPTGTPIMAAGEGTVELAGARGNYGVYLRLRHNREYSTAYAHMSAIARGLHIGSHVHQGQVIGYVGATGLATGPHLYYEVLVNDRQINPLSVRLPTGIKLAGTELKAFLVNKSGTDAMLATLPQASRLAKKAF